MPTSVFVTLNDLGIPEWTYHSLPSDGLMTESIHGHFEESEWEVTIQPETAIHATLLDAKIMFKSGLIMV